MKFSYLVVFCIFLVNLSISAELVDFGALTKPVSSDLATVIGLDKNQGAEIVEVYEITPAAALELQPGDVITKLNNKPVFHATNLALVIASLFQKDEEIELCWVRDGKENTETVKLNRTMSQADMKTKYLSGVRNNPQPVRRVPNAQRFDSFKFGGLFTTPKTSNRTSGVHFHINSPDGKVSVGHQDHTGKRHVKIINKEEQVIFDEPIFAADLTSKIPETYHQWVKAGFGVRVQVKPSAERDVEEMKRLLRELNTHEGK